MKTSILYIFLAILLFCIQANGQDYFFPWEPYLIRLDVLAKVDTLKNPNLKEAFKIFYAKQLYIKVELEKDSNFVFNAFYSECKNGLEYWVSELIQAKEYNLAYVYGKQLLKENEEGKVTGNFCPHHYKNRKTNPPCRKYRVILDTMMSITKYLKYEKDYIYYSNEIKRMNDLHK